MLLQLIGTQLAKYLTKEHIYEDHYFRISIDDIKSALEPGDVVLVEGQSRISNAIQFITNSNWSHAAIFIGEAGSLSHCLIEVKAVDSRTTVLTVDGEKFAEVVYQNDFLDDVTSNKTNFLMEEILTYVVDSIRATRYKQFLDKVVFSNLLGCGVEYDKDVSVIKVAQVPVAF